LPERRKGVWSRVIARSSAIRWAASLCRRPWIAANRDTKSPPLSPVAKSAHLPVTRLTLHELPCPPPRLAQTYS